MYKSATIRDITYNLLEKDQSWQVHVKVHLEVGGLNSAKVPLSANGHLTLDLMLTDTTKISFQRSISRNVTDGEFDETIVLSVPKVCERVHFFRVKIVLFKNCGLRI